MHRLPNSPGIAFFALAVVLCLCLVPVSAAAASSHLRVWAVSDCDKVLRDAPARTSSAVWSQASGRVSLHAARNEYVAFQAMVTARGADLHGVDAALGRLTSLDGTIPAAKVSLFREHYLHVTEPSTAMYGEQSTTGPGWYPDPLVPLDAPDGGAPFDVAEGQNQGIWVDIYVPPDASPGLYRGTLRITATGETEVVLPVEVEVWDFALPQETHLPSFFMYQPGQLAAAHGVAKYGEEYLDIEAEYLRMARAHRMNVSTSIYPEVHGTGNSTTIVWDSWHDEFASRHLDGTIFPDGRGSDLYALPIGLDNPDPAEHGGLGSAEFEATFITMLRQFRDHFQARGWYDRSFLYIVDEPNDAEAYDLVRYYGDLIDRSGTGFPLMVTEGPVPQETGWGSLTGYVDIWCCGGDAWPGPMQARQSLGERAWTYNGGEPYAGSQVIDTPGVAPRTWAWIAERYGVECWLLWDVCYFHDLYNGETDNDIWSDPVTYDQRHSGGSWPDWGNGDGTLFYPGTPQGIAGPVASQRMKSWRRGAQDYEYMWMLRQRGQGALVDEVLAGMVPYAFGDAEGKTTSWSDDPAVWEEARARMGEALAAHAEYPYRYYFAEGYTGAGFQEYLCLGNPGPSEAHVFIDYFFPDGGGSSQVLTVPSASRRTVDVNAWVGADREVAAVVYSDRDIGVERPMYFSYGPGWTGGHDVVGVSLSRSWFFAEGYTGQGFDQWVCVLNPGDAPADLTFRFQTQEAGEVVRDGGTVPARSRRTYLVNDLLGAGYQNSLQLVSSLPVVAERPIYFDYRGGAYGWNGGHCVMGVPSLASEYFFAEGTTRAGFEEWLTLQNPGDDPITIEADFQLGAGQGGPVHRSYTVEGGRRHTVYVPSEVGEEKDVSVSLSSGDDFLAERPMYFRYRGFGADWDGGHCVSGALTTASDLFFAEGYTGGDFHTWLCLQNPYESDAAVQVFFYTQEAGALPPVALTVPAYSRVSLRANDLAGPGFQLSTRVKVVSGPPVAAERPMYFSWAGRDGGHDAVGRSLPPQAFAGVNDFAYQLQDVNLTQMGASRFDLVVMDFSSDGSEAGRYTVSQISSLQHSPGGEKVVLSYLSIGEAEDYRWYWRDAWDADHDGVPDPGAPSWLGPGDPDWEGNYYVHYWDPAWQAIVMQYLDKVMAAGFDGVYLDLVDAYEFWEPGGDSGLDRAAAKEEMVEFVKSIASYCRVEKGKAAFAVFPQNGEGLAAYPDYVQTITGIGKEDLFYDDNTAQPVAYTREAAGYLDTILRAGRVVLVTDYPTQPALIDDFYDRTKEKGYIPYATVRDLDVLTVNPGHAPD
jgi:cysteinyl-tRNA synthetase, unknown class